MKNELKNNPPVPFEDREKENQKIMDSLNAEFTRCNGNFDDGETIREEIDSANSMKVHIFFLNMCTRTDYSKMNS